MSEREEKNLADWLHFDVTPPPLSLALDAELATLKPVAMRRPRREYLMFLGVVGLVVTGMLTVLGVRADLHQMPTGWIPLVALLWIAGIAAAAWVSLVPKAGSVMPRWRLASWIVLATASVYVALGLAVHPAGASSLHYGWERFLRGHGCLELGLATAILPVSVGMWFLRGTAPARGGWIIATIGAASGCAGGLLLHFYCKIADGPHIGLIHGGVVGCAAMLTALIATLATRARR